MSSTSKGFTLLIVIILAVISLIAVESAFAQSIPKPSVPEFILKLVDHSYDVPPKTSSSTDPYTGKVTSTTIPGYHVYNKTVEVIVKNAQFTPYSISNQQKISLYYNVSYKGHYEEEWKYYRSGWYAFDSDTWPCIFPQSASNYTVITIGAPNEGEMDFRVQAQIGYYDISEVRFPAPGQPFTVYAFIGQESGWSNTKTIDLSDNSISTTSTPNPTSQTTSTSPNPTPTPSVPEFPSWVTLFLLAMMVAAAGLLVYHKRKTKTA